MNDLVVRLPRRVIPRWRDFSTTVALGELGATKLVGKSQFHIAADLEEAKQNWVSHKTAFTAGDLMTAALVERDWVLAVETAEFLDKDGTLVPTFTKEIAQLILRWHAGKQFYPVDERKTIEISPFNAQTIGAVRRSLADFPRSPMHWVELALGYTIIGKIKKAERAIQIALHLAPSDRFVVRSATRFFLHSEKPEVAKRVLLKCNATAYDPWLLAAHLSVANIMDESAKFHRQARDIFNEKKISPFHLSELGVALATEEVRGGNDRRGRKLFSQALVDPTENAVAQALWAKNQIVFEQHDNLLSKPFSFEANARYQVEMENWEQAVVAAKNWQNDEPFSARPAILGSFLACTVQENFDVAEQVARKGLIANPEDATLTNNLVYALACAGHVDEGKKLLDQFPKSSLTKEEEITFIATEGLLEFRSGNHMRGREKYLVSIEAARTARNVTLRLRAAIQLSREELRINGTDAKNFVEEVITLAEGNHDPGTKLVLKKLLRESAALGIINNTTHPQIFSDLKFTSPGKDAGVLLQSTK